VTATGGGGGGAATYNTNSVNGTNGTFSTTGTAILTNPGMRGSISAGSSIITGWNPVPNTGSQIALDSATGAYPFPTYASASFVSIGGGCCSSISGVPSIGIIVAISAPGMGGAGAANIPAVGAYASYVGKTAFGAPSASGLYNGGNTTILSNANGTFTAGSGGGAGGSGGTGVNNTTTGGFCSGAPGAGGGGVIVEW
jgi:hypothetical protein